ncbi:MAG: prephenate dehydrogenase [Limisphaerales bacterium]
MPPVPFRHASILGVGLLGGSLGLALRHRGLASRVTGFVRRAAAAAEVLAAGAVDDATTDLAAAVRGADLVVLCTPVAQIGELARSLAPHLAAGTVVTDVGSVKAAVIGAAEGPVHAAGAHFVGSHPMAGGEKTGVGAARADLFEGAVSLVTPTSATDPAAAEAVRQLWRGVGARVVDLDADTHDALVARTSHLPHVLAFALARYVLDPAASPLQRGLCATGFRDTTRIAAGSPPMWRDILLGNRAHVLAALDGLGEQLAELRTAVAAGDAAAVELFLTEASTRRSQWSGPRTSAD